MKILNRMRRLLIKIFISIGGDFVLRKINRAPRILFWHGIEDVSNRKIETESYSVSLFKKQIKYLNKYYEIISIIEFEKRLLNNSFSNREIVLTFDDGYANNLYIVEPILRKYALPFTVFISTDNISTGEYFPTTVNNIVVKGSGLNSLKIPSLNLDFDISSKEKKDEVSLYISLLLKSLPINQVKDITKDLINNIDKTKWDELKNKYKSSRPMNWNEVSELSSKKGVTIGSHCKWHTCCHSKQSEYDLNDEIVNSKKLIEDELGFECKYFAYPNGDFTEISNNLVCRTYNLGFTTDGENKITSKINKSNIPRITLSPPNIYYFKLLINLFPKK